MSVMQTPLQATVTRLRLPPIVGPFFVVNPVMVLTGAVPDTRLFAPEHILALTISMPMPCLSVRMRLRLLQLTLQV